MTSRPHRAARAEARPAVPACATHGPPGPRVTLERALSELELVHRLEQARLLRMACRLALCAACEDAGRGAALARWRRQCASALALARADGVEPPASLVLCARRVEAAWPAARALARASLELDDCRAGRRLALR
jgi:hypothetical protein